VRTTFFKSSQPIPPAPTTSTRQADKESASSFRRDPTSCNVTIVDRFKTETVEDEIVASSFVDFIWRLATNFRVHYRHQLDRSVDQRQWRSTLNPIQYRPEDLPAPTFSWILYRCLPLLSLFHNSCHLFLSSVLINPLASALLIDNSISTFGCLRACLAIISTFLPHELVPRGTSQIPPSVSN
jgi:hypothetical protein